VERYEISILRYLWQRTGDQERAADLTQETFLSAYQHLDQLACRSSFRPWLYSIARNKLLMEQRHKRPEAYPLELLNQDDHGKALLQTDECIRCVERDAIYGVLKDMSPTLKEALLLSTVWGLPSREVAQTLGISPEAARQRIGRAKEQFRHLYQVLDGVD
jgi:RNA polymerase sigma-70 factor (ECF subfamily)